MWCKVFSVISLTVLCFINSNAETSARVDIRFRILQESLIAVPVFINGQGPFDFILDTGTETSLVDQDLARQLGLNAVDHVTLRTPSGQKDLARAFLSHVSLGMAWGANLEVLIDRRSSISALDPKLRGILGHNFLSQFDLLLDYKHARVSFFAGGSEPPIEGVRIPLRLRNGLPVLTVRTTNGGSLDLLLDSGASALTLFKTEIAGFRSCSLSECKGTIRTTVAASQAIQGVIPTLSIGDVWLHNLPVFVAQRPSGDPVDGMLPASLFPNVYISNREGYAIVRR